MPGERIRERSSDLVPAGQELSGVRSRTPFPRHLRLFNGGLVRHLFRRTKSRPLAALTLCLSWVESGSRKGLQLRQNSRCRPPVLAATGSC